MTSLSVAVPDDGSVSTSVHRSVLASLPGRFRIQTGGGDVHLVSCQVSGWLVAAMDAVAGGPRALVLAGLGHLTRTETGALAALNDRALAAGVLVTVDQLYSFDPSWRAAQERILAFGGRAVLLESVVTADADGDSGVLDAAMLAQLATVRPLLEGKPVDLRLRRARRHYLICGGNDDFAVSLAGVPSNAAHSLHIALVGSAERWSVLIPAHPARPSRVSRFDAAGEHIARPHFEGSQRAGWTALHDALVNGSPAPYGLDELGKDLSLMESLAAI